MANIQDSPSVSPYEARPITANANERQQKTYSGMTARITT